LKAIVDNGTVVPELLLLWLQVNRELIRAKADEAGHGTKRLPTEVLHAHSLALPPRPEQERMAVVLCDLLSRLETNEAQSRTLAALRDTLLPKLISGEIRVPDAEAAVAEIA
jgi:type I restriction enzyme S subunit